MQVEHQLAKKGQTFRSASIGKGFVRRKVDAKYIAFFRCQSCGTVFDALLEDTDFPKFRGNSELSVTKTQVYFLGTCEKCAKGQMSS